MEIITIFEKFALPLSFAVTFFWILYKFVKDRIESLQKSYTEQIDRWQKKMQEELDKGETERNAQALDIRDLQEKLLMYYKEDKALLYKLTNDTAYQLKKNSLLLEKMEKKGG
jgi:hypothetical protein